MVWGVERIYTYLSKWCFRVCYFHTFGFDVPRKSRNALPVVFGFDSGVVFGGSVLSLGLGCGLGAGTWYKVSPTSQVLRFSTGLSHRHLSGMTISLIRIGHILTNKLKRRVI